MFKNNNLLTIVGFLMAGTGFLALVLSLVGVKLVFLTWIDKPGPLFGFLIRLIMIILGMVIIYMTQANFEKEEI